MGAKPYQSDSSASHLWVVTGARNVVAAGPFGPWNSSVAVPLLCGWLEPVRLGLYGWLGLSRCCFGFQVAMSCRTNLAHRRWHWYDVGWDVHYLRVHPGCWRIFFSWRSCAIWRLMEALRGVCTDNHSCPVFY